MKHTTIIFRNPKLEEISNIFNQHQTAIVTVTHNHDASKECEIDHHSLCKYNYSNILLLLQDNYRQGSYKILEQLLSHTSRGIILDLTNLHGHEKNRINKVRGSLIDRSSSCEGVSYKKLIEVGRDMVAKKSVSLSLPTLKRVGGDLYILRARKLNLPRISSAKKIYVSAENFEIVKEAIDINLHKRVYVPR